MEVFPVKTGPQTRAQFAQRFELSKHEGTDIFAPAGAELVAVADGVVRQATEKKGGHAVYLTEPDGTQYYYAHLDAFAHPLMPGETRRVEAGDPIGYVGTSGNAKGGPPHVHFEWRPKGGAKRDPFSALVRLAELETRVVRATRKPAARPARSSRARPSRAPRARPSRAPRGAPAQPSGWGRALGMFIIFFGISRALGRR